jgi:hypothetical protein
VETPPAHVSASESEVRARRLALDEATAAHRADVAALDIASARVNRQLEIFAAKGVP